VTVAFSDQQSTGHVVPHTHNVFVAASPQA